MTHPDDFDRSLPRCPRCTTTDQVERGGSGSRPWLCVACDLVFAGTQPEAAAEARKRHEDATRDAGYRESIERARADR